MSGIPTKQELEALRTQGAQNEQARAQADAERIIAQAGDEMRAAAARGQASANIYEFSDGAGQYGQLVFKIVSDYFAAAGHRCSLGGNGHSGDNREWIFVSL